MAEHLASDHWWSPGRVPDEPVEPTVVIGGFDTDGDGRTDTVIGDDGVDLLLSTDLDGDGFADQVLRIGPDGVVRDASPAPMPEPSSLVVDDLMGGAGAGCI